RARFVVRVVRRNLEGLAEPEARDERLVGQRTETLVFANPHAAPRAFDEVAAQRLEDAGRDLRQGRLLAVHESLCDRPSSCQKGRFQWAVARSMPRIFMSKRD